MIYPGGKNAAGTWQRLINQIPPHEVYTEPFVGSGTILRMKRPARRSFALDLCPGALDALREAVPAGTDLIMGCGIEWLELHADFYTNADFVYCDPPYLPETCRSRMRYEHVLDAAGHRRLLEILKRLRCPVMISGYRSALYDELLRSWRTDRFPQMTRGGYAAEEWLWMNYDPPVELHDYRYVGRNFREREKFRRQQRRWSAKLAKMGPLQRQALLSVLGADQGAAPETAGTPAASPEEARVDRLMSITHRRKRQFLSGWT